MSWFLPLDSPHLDEGQSVLLSFNYATKLVKMAECCKTTVPTDPTPQPPILLRHNDGYMEQVMICTLCHEIPLEPVTTPCHHIFCQPCINEALLHKLECPNDRHPLVASDVKPISGILRRIWEQIGVKCSACESWTGTLGTYRNHASRCVGQHEVRNMEEYQHKINAMKRQMVKMEAHYRKQIADLTKMHEKKIEDMGKKRSREIEDLKVTLMQKFEEITTRQHKLLEAELQETIPAVRAAAKAEVLAKHDPDYRYFRTSVVELTQLICRNLERLPPSIDRNRIYNCVKHCYDDMRSSWSDNPPHFNVDMRMLLNVCRASTWFSAKQLWNMNQWCAEQGWG